LVLSKHLSGSRLLVVASLAIALASLTAVVFMLLDRGSAERPAAASVEALVDEARAKLSLPRRSVELTSEKAMRARNAIRQGDYATAHVIATEVLTRSRLQDWSFEPFATFMESLSNVDDPGFEARLSEWASQDGNDAIPVLTRAQYYYDTGWFRRGNGFIAGIQNGNLKAYDDDMAKALDDVDSAIRMNPGNPYSFALRLRILGGSGMSLLMKNAFEEAIGKYPTYYPLYDIVLETLQPKWGGTIEAMYAFVDFYAGHVAADSPLKLLYLNLYGDLLDSASISCSDGGYAGDKLAQCVGSHMSADARPELDGEVRAALQLYDHRDKYLFGAAVEPILLAMFRTDGGDAYSTAVLQHAADIMHSDTQLNQDESGRNDYVIDNALAESWFVKGFFDNALKKDKDALKDVEVSSFPGEEAKDVAPAAIYEHSGRVYDKLHQYIDMITSIQATIQLGGKSIEEHYICYAYYQLKDNEAALQACTTAIDRAPENLFARYWRGQIFKDMRKMDSALRDLTIVADSESEFRARAAIDLSMIHFDSGDSRGALDVLNKYTYLYDPATNDREDIAVSYNNRCYAYMQLGELRKALDNCKASLEYGSLPEAYRKEQELIKRLGMPGKDL
jgi:tetratricopeptide (TPR) repeat protein